MYLSKELAIQLIKSGFKRTYYVDEISPFDIFNSKDEEWVVGGRILPEGNLLVDQNVYNEGTWLPSIADLIYWLSDNSYPFTLECKGNGHGYKIIVTNNIGEELSAKGGTIEFVLFKAIMDILKNNF